MFSLIVTTIILCSLNSFAESKKCPKIVTQKDFDLNRYTGVWYEAYRNLIVFELGATCVNATYTLNSDGSVRVFNQAINFIGRRTNINGTARVKDPSEPGAFIVTFNRPSQKGDYNVITTDYDQYALVYACRDSILGKWEFVWFLSRTKTLSNVVVQNLKMKLVEMGVDPTIVKPSKQNC